MTALDVAAIFEREIAAAEADHETSTHIAWLSRLRDEVIEAALKPAPDPIRGARVTETPTPPLPADRFAVTLSLSIPPGFNESEQTVREQFERWLAEQEWQAESMTVSRRMGRW